VLSTNPLDQSSLTLRYLFCRHSATATAAAAAAAAAAAIAAEIKEAAKTKERRGYLTKQIVVSFWG
jgi:hypothetical protein